MKHFILLNGTYKDAILNQTIWVAVVGEDLPCKTKGGDCSDCFVLSVQQVEQTFTQFKLSVLFQIDSSPILIACHYI